MALSQNKILLIVEGEKTEPKILEQIGMVKWNETSKLEIIHLGTNIYSLYKTIENLNIDYNSDSTSTIEVLKQILKDRNRDSDLEKLQQKYPYIYLFFDFEFQDNHYDEKDKKKVLLDMMNYFSDETDNGLLLINYPMIEAFRDYKEPLPNIEYKELSISIDDVKKYKSIVNDRGTNKNYSKYNLYDFELIFIQNLMKANYIANGDYCIPLYDEFINIVKGENVLNGQFDWIKDNNSIAILCTLIFTFIYYYGKDLYENIVNKYR